MSTFTSQQQSIALRYLAMFHLLIIASSNYLVQIPFTVVGFHTTWGAFSFPFIFLATDLTVRVFGATLARKIILIVMIPSLIVSYVLSVIFAEGAYQGFEGLATYNSFVGRIAIASLLAYLLGQVLDIQIFNKLRALKAWWIAPAASTLLGNGLDTLAFFGIAFYESPNTFMALHWPEIAMADFAFKLVVSLGLFIPLYGVLLSYLTKTITTTNIGAPFKKS